MPPACEGILTYAPEQALANLPMPACAALSSNRTQASRVDKRVEPLMHVQGTPVSMPALTSAVLLVVQASGQISVHALVRGPESAHGRPFAPWRALKGNASRRRRERDPAPLMRR